jgi:hypothetical protein
MQNREKERYVREMKDYKKNHPDGKPSTAAEK